ncbi:PREDICTED: sorting nexin-24 [Haliaeetus leucocephalus]|uniref:sorting nexin-24 n=1 Tax=Haliaeetus leucocephalus TaxID=52644 RepID=UPI00053CCC37|nr:PREDICTED: sorting nexin-24 [Haliaeetus leucocephalus]
MENFAVHMKAAKAETGKRPLRTKFSLSVASSAKVEKGLSGTLAVRRTLRRRACMARRLVVEFQCYIWVFKIEVLMSGRKHFVEKRYSEFHALHKKLKKFIRTPEIPSKHVRNWVPKVLEQRRQGLELYLQTVILENEELPKIFLDFLNVRHVPTLPKAESCGSFDETESEESSKLSHQPVLLFLRDPYVLPKANDDFPNVVIEGILHGIFYPHLLPR